MKTKMLIMITCLLMIQTLRAEPEMKGTPSELTGYLTGIPSTVTLSGKSEIKTQADQAIIHLKVTTENKYLRNALTENQNLRAIIYDNIKKMGVSSDKVVSSKFSSTPEYGFWGSKPDKYKVENFLHITIQDEKQFGKIAQLIDQYEEIDYSGIKFEKSNEKELKDQAIAQACEAALKKKKIYEEKLKINLEVKTFHIDSIDYDGGDIEVGRRSSRGRPGFSSSKEANYNIVQTEGVSVQSAFDELKFTARVTVEFTVLAK